MKLPITDQFLLDLLEGASNTAYFILKRRRTLNDLTPGPKNPIFEKYRKNKNRQAFNKLIYYLKKNNFITVKNLQGKNAVILTKKGTDKALRASFKVGSKFTERKDGKWIMVIFDIPQNRRKDRGLLRSVLKNLGFRLLQQSVWVSSYDVSERMEKSFNFYGLDKYVRIFLVDEI